MEKMKKCKICGADIAKNAKICPKCGAKNKKHTVFWVILVLFAILLVAAAIGGTSDGPEKIDTAEGSSVVESDTPQKSESQPKVFHVGDIVELNGVNVTFLGVNESSKNQSFAPEDGNVFVTFEFDIDNQTDSDVAISSMLSFEAYFDDYASSISISALANSDKPQLDGTIASMRKMTGVVGYEAPADWAKAEIRFTPDFWSGKEIIFEYTK